MALIITVLNFLMMFVVGKAFSGQSRPHSSLFFVALAAYLILRKEGKEQKPVEPAVAADGPSGDPKHTICPVCSQKNPLTTELCIRCGHSLDEPAPKGLVRAPKWIVAARIVRATAIVLLIMLDIFLLSFTGFMTNWGQFRSEAARAETVEGVNYVFAAINVPCIAGLAWLNAKIRRWKRSIDSHRS